MPTIADSTEELVQKTSIFDFNEQGLEKKCLVSKKPDSCMFWNNPTLAQDCPKACKFYLDRSTYLTNFGEPIQDSNMPVLFKALAYAVTAREVNISLGNVKDVYNAILEQHKKTKLFKILDGHGVKISLAEKRRQKNPYCCFVNYRRINSETWERHNCVTEEFYDTFVSYISQQVKLLEERAREEARKRQEHFELVEGFGWLSLEQLMAMSKVDEFEEEFTIDDESDDMGRPWK
jgi:hypothetical protein